MYAKPLEPCLAHSKLLVKGGFALLLACSLCSVTSPKGGRDTALNPEPGSWDQAELDLFWGVESQVLPLLNPPRLNKGLWNYFRSIQKYFIFLCMLISHIQNTAQVTRYQPFILLKGQRTLIKMSKPKIVWRAKKQMREACSLWFNNEFCIKGSV